MEFTQGIIGTQSIREDSLSTQAYPEKIVELKNQTFALIRPICPSDKELIGRGFHELGKETVRQRFHGPKKTLDDNELEFLTRLDGYRHFALGAVSTGDETPDGLGVARYVRLVDDPETAELAITVKDKYQGLGLGTALLHEICEHAKKNEIRVLQGIVHTTNSQMIALLRKRKNFQLKTVGPGVLELYGPLY